MSRIQQMIQELRTRSDLGIANETHSWRIVITKGRDLCCEVIVPHEILEWHATIRNRHDEKEIWSDWMDYSGYENRPLETLEVEMANDILAFVNRVSIKEPLLPVKIHED